MARHGEFPWQVGEPLNVSLHESNLVFHALTTFGPYEDLDVENQGRTFARSLGKCQKGQKPFNSIRVTWQMLMQ